MMKIYIDGRDGQRRDVSQLWEKLVWSGSKQSCARKVEFTLPSADTDKYLPEVKVQLSDHVAVYWGQTCILDGFVTNLRKTTDIGFLTVRVYDRGLAMNCNEAVFDFQNTTPAEAVNRICSSFGIPVGAVPDTGDFRLTRKFVGVSLYQILATFYTQASAVTGKQYALGFQGEEFCVWELTPSTVAEIPVLKPNNNLLTVSVTEDSENIVNRVVALDSSNNQVLSAWESTSEATHGTRQRILQSADSPADSAAQLLGEYGAPTRQVSVTVLGDPSLVSGKYVRLQEPYTGIQETFAITADTHTWASGQYSCVLTLDPDNDMVAVNAGE